MTRNLLEDYPHICAKIAELEGRQERVVSDTVSGSSVGPPYTQHPIGIRGIVHLTPVEEAKLERLQEKKQAIEDWVEALRNQREKNVVEFHALKGWEWNRVFAKTNHPSPEAARKFYEKVLKENL